MNPTAPTPRPKPLQKQTKSAKAEEVARKWWIIDAKDQVVGKVAVAAARLLRGKDKTIFTPHCDTGDYVVIINAKDARFTGNKETQKRYVRVTGYIGSKREDTVPQLRAKHPDRILRHAIAGMVQHNRLARHVIKKLHISADGNHKFQDKNPAPFAL